MISFILAGLALADPNSPAKHNPKWTDHKQSDPGMANRTASIAVSPSAEPVESVVLELAGIVVLCAKEEKEKFEKEWARYVKHHALKGIYWMWERAPARSHIQ